MLRVCLRLGLLSMDGGVVVIEVVVGDGGSGSSSLLSLGTRAAAASCAGASGAPVVEVLRLTLT